MKVSTEKFKEMVSKAVQGAGNNKLIPITQLMGITQVGENLMLTTTDATNYLYITHKMGKSQDFNVTVPVEQFSKLIGKMTSKEISLEIKDNLLEVVGNGTYTIELPLDEDGKLIVYPNPKDDYFDGDFEYNGSMSKEDIAVILDSVKPSLATSYEYPSITNYYVGDMVVATDSMNCASFDVGMFDDDSLISSQLMDLLGVIADKNINYFMNGEVMLFVSDVGEVFTQQIQTTDEYPIDKLKAFIEQDFESVCKVRKDDFIALLERIALFVGKNDDRAVRLYFEKDGIRVSNKARKSNELIEYVDSKQYKAYDCEINIDMLLTQLKAYNADVVELHYNNDVCIKFVNEDLVQIISLMEEA